MIEENDIELFKSLLHRDNFLIVIHRSPDGDCLGTGFALKRFLEKKGKKVTMGCNDEVPKKLRFLSDGQIVLKPEFQPQTVVTVDTATAEMMGIDYQTYGQDVFLAIDHHATNSLYAHNSIVYGTLSSAGELLYSLIEECGFQANDYIAQKLYAAISFDTGCFKFSNVTSNTHIIASKLLKFGFDAASMNRQMFDIAPLAQLKIENMLLQDAELFCDGQVVVVALTQNMIKSIGAKDGDFEGLTAIARRIEGTRVGVTIREMDDGEMRVSLRSEGDLNVADIASKFGGGGHIRAAGCKIDGDLDQVKKIIIAAIADGMKK